MAPNRVMLSVAGLPTLYRLVPADSRHSFAAQALVSDHYYPVAELLIQPGCDHTPPPSNERCPRLALKPWVPCRFLKWLSHQACPEVASPLDHKRFAILGLGSSCYPRFCAAADMFESMMLAAGAPLSWTQLHVAAGCCTLAVSRCSDCIGRPCCSSCCTVCALQHRQDPAHNSILPRSEA